MVVRCRDYQTFFFKTRQVWVAFNLVPYFGIEFERNCEQIAAHQYHGCTWARGGTGGTEKESSRPYPIPRPPRHASGGAVSAGWEAGRRSDLGSSRTATEFCGFTRSMQSAEITPKHHTC